ncbi:MAG: pyridoxamine 5'-phosphate oxidase family protein [Methanomassiliicoccaceae archaeon]|jgi:predicted pyridoxine 5'-phosphate oxidase superfamily flavin-nucleotide-binding protein|nr:pyridoxamine 5'-phosphate oxidase family protein [Methanomassiliicoccaceae archaeon]
MVKLTSEIKNDMSKVKLFPFATSSRSGEPNVVPIGMLLLQDDDETVWVIDNFMQKSLKNVTENPQASFYIWSPDTEGSYQVKGTVKIETSGKDYEFARDFAKNKKKELPAKTLLKMKITSVYSVKPGPTAGAKIL